MSTSNDIITRCPECATAFRATKEVLSIAGGTVRCGSCLRVFDAKDHAITTKTEKVVKSSKTTPQIDNNVAEKTGRAVASTDEQPALKQTNKEPTDADNLTANIVSVAKNKHQQHSTAHDNKTKTEPYFTLVDEPQNSIDASPAPPAYDDEEQSESIGYTPHLDSDETPSLLLNPIELEDNIELDNLEEDNKPFPWALLLGACVMGVLLAAQVAWLRFDTLSSRASYQPYYAEACRILGCTLHRQHDIKHIQATQLLVRSHPNKPKALLVDAIIINNARFQQPYPGLLLSFLNIDGNIVASRGFQPEEYLRGELIGATIMPVNQPIQLSLAIVDPGESAVNYHIDVIAPKDEK